MFIKLYVNIIIILLTFTDLGSHKSLKYNIFFFINIYFSMIRIINLLQPFRYVNKTVYNVQCNEHIRKLKNARKAGLRGRLL